ncbi:MAG: Bax inhibitor-1/YccA family protein [Cryomorphaceae bacterium]|jgi:FtsH-binding integral membrane protein|nr:Bax inhibitor-1/YccA family protein [Cryomorphaceae bacterium]
MDNNFIHSQDGYTREISREFFRNVYSYMFGALGISGIIAYTCGTPEFFTQYFLNSTGTGFAPIMWIVVFSPIVLGLVIQWGFQRLSMGMLLGLFIVYSALMGLSLSTIFLVYKLSAIVMTFFVTAGAFGGMAVLGYTTKTDLTKFGSLLYMVFIGMFIAAIVNMFLGNGMLDFVISVLGVFVFTGLTAYHMQQLKGLSENAAISETDRSKLALVGGLQLYILFVNLFLSLLRLMGGRN